MRSHKNSASMHPTIANAMAWSGVIGRNEDCGWARRGYRSARRSRAGALPANVTVTADDRARFPRRGGGRAGLSGIPAGLALLGERREALAHLVGQTAAGGQLGQLGVGGIDADPVADLEGQALVAPHRVE